MEMGLSVWADLVMDTVEVAVLGAVLWQLFKLCHDIRAMLRVVRRMDRKPFRHDDQRVNVWMALTKPHPR
jgi:hypothetical protein